MRYLLLFIIAYLLCAFPAFSQDTKENADFKLAVNLYNDKLYDLALEQFQQFLSRYPNAQQAIEAKFYLGQTQSKLGRHDDARFTFQNFALNNPDNPRAPEAWWNVAEAYAAQKNFREAAVSFERIKVFHPKSKLAASGLLKASEYFGTAGDPANAEAMLRTLVRDYSAAEEVTVVRLKLAELSIVAGQFEAARAEAQRIVGSTKKAEEKSRAQLVLARALMGLSKYQDVEKAVEEILKNPRSAVYSEAMFIKGEIKLQTGNREEAVASLRAVAADTARASAPLRQSALLKIGDSFVAARQHDLALPYFTQATNIVADRLSEALYKAAVAAERTKQTQKAGEYYTRAFRLKPNGLDEKENKTYLVGAFKGAAFLQNYQEALKLARQFQDEFPKDKLTPHLLGEAARIAQLEIKDLRHAVELYQEIVSEYSASSIADYALFHTGMILEQLGNTQEAIQTFESLEQRFPSSDFVFNAQEQVKQIKLFTPTSRKEGVEKLALLIGDVIAQKSKGDLSFRLAEIYFQELKEYKQAIQQYTLALEADLDAAKRPHARYQLAQAYEILAWKASREGNIDENKLYTNQAITNYELLLRAFPHQEFHNKAVTALFSLKVGKAVLESEIKAVYQNFVNGYPELPNKGQVLLRIGEAYSVFVNDSSAIPIYRSVLQAEEPSVAADAMIGLAFALEAVGKEDSALVVLENFLRAYPNHPRSPEAAWNIGQMASRQGKVQQAVHAYEIIEQRYPNSSQAYRLELSFAQLFLDTGDFSNMLRYLQRYLEKEQSDYYHLPEIPVSVWYNIAKCYHRIGNLRDAKRHYLSALAQSPATAPETGEMYFALASIAREEGNVELATQYLRQAGSVSGGSADQRVRAALEAANLLFRGEAYRDAVARYSDVLKETTSDSLKQYVQARIAVSYYRMNNAGEASKLVKNFVKAYPDARNDAAEFEFERGRHLLRREELDKAKTTFEALLEEYDDTPIAPDAQYWLGRVVEAKGDVQAASKIYETVIQRYPGHPIALRARLSHGNIFYTAEQWEPAVQQYRAILENEQVAPDVVPFAMTNLILTYKELSLYDAALELTRKFIERFPNDSSLLNKRIDIGVLYQKLGYYDQSVLHLQSLLENAEPDIEAELRYYIGEAYYYKGDHQQAILEFLKVPYLVTRRTSVDWVATSFYMAGQSYEKMSRFDQAISMYQQILERQNIDPRFKAAAQKEIDRVNALVKSQR